ncbi:MAG TPA: DUF2304 domain-containing protein [Kofleriaceae bacterium]|jgi:hypothetical protein|nr:DUF2304 domain-containing protein [Kofleriaceae bacterium]
MQQTVENYWMFGAVCLVIALVLLRLLFRERITLQGSMSFLSFLVFLGLMAVFPETTGRIAKKLGFTLMSNFFFCAAIAALAILHLRALVTLSRVHVRSIVLTQELAILHEKIDRLETSEARRSSNTPASSSLA